ncbi:MAG: acetyl-CoA acetyltransferase [Deltaproteobacteria bacterium RIFCSPLOWO2_01_44_7]|nr:MAG: acetyl-CoA acetyltransferase [Deltaproteobacteria bacterium RIFCSPHIGHO2_01_FULL_43_49]OGQ14722.1 MAG: acetyl-CoA acetyltransferase [Deltaproteobacteria bacterium RIFCSPHIGHO2_02_FULL_44_53]OGQ28108.1 MAG: acetyl-CoA acetyltransferase [Deltaproteobacteria bacterium RIFCSPHIGHO2_12_FULL_44_21]OGQ31320.1 MAG: acetyl-CoA acetyltransferase [Deltaproteobacteria bacterium RIFCSPLOWO2_01_FULL_45_74]OGQ40801.1 MAG: acetyl-CoA acetyltransferase [Deltaproteobacteria bacterium RIFCSPLOWO2_01_44_7]
MNEAVIVAAVRSPMGRANKGQFIHTRIDDLAAEVIRAALARVPQIKPEMVEDVLIGCAMPEGEQGLNVARNISFLAGIPFGAGAVTVNRFCASSLTTINMAADAVLSGGADICVTGGIESMSHVPMGGFNPSLNEKLFGDGKPAAYIGMGEVAEILATKYKISREEQDRFSLGSHQKAIKAQKEGKLKKEILECSTVQADGSIKKVLVDEGPREDTTLEKLAQLKPAFKANGTVTAGNSSPLTDGAACVIVMSAAKAKQLGIKPLAKIRSWAVAGVDPALMGIGPVDAVPKALKKAGMKLSDVDLLELNEAFAVQVLAVSRDLNWDMTKLNVHGGAIALGHPLGCSGARIMATLLNALEIYNKAIGLETLCVGGGQGVATIVERL